MSPMHIIIIVMIIATIGLYLLAFISKRIREEGYYGAIDIGLLTIVLIGTLIYTFVY